MKLFFFFLIFFNLSFFLNAEENPAPFGIKLGEHISKSFEGNLKCSINETVEDYKLYRCSIDPPKPDRHFENYDVQFDNKFNVWNITATKKIDKKDEKYYRNFVKNLSDILIKKYNMTRIIDIRMCDELYNDFYKKDNFIAIGKYEKAKKIDKIYFKQKNKRKLSKEAKKFLIPDGANFYELCKLHYGNGRLMGIEFFINKYTSLFNTRNEDYNIEQQIKLLEKHQKIQHVYNFNFSFIPTTIEECINVLSKSEGSIYGDYDCNTEMLLANDWFEIKIRLKEQISVKPGFDLYIHYKESFPFGGWPDHMNNYLKNQLQNQNQSIEDSNF